MKKSLVIKGIAMVLIIFVFGLAAIGCRRDKNKDNTDNGINDGNNVSDDNNNNNGGSNTDDNNNTDDNGGNTVGDISEVDGADKSIGLFSGDEKKIVLADYIDTKGQDGITYEVKTSNAAVELSPIADGEFTITACEVNEITNVVVSIVVYHNGTEKLTVELSVKVVERGGFIPDDNVDTDW